jgi:hypothetical protein
MIGYCAHVISLIYYLSYYRHNEQDHTPAAYLYSFLVDIAGNEPPSKARIVRLKRKNKTLVVFNLDELKMSSKKKHNNKDDLSDKNKESPGDKDNNNNPNPVDNKADDLSDKNKESQSDNDNNNNPKEQNNKSLKQNNIKKQKQNINPIKTRKYFFNNSEEQNIFIENFKRAIPPWGGSIMYRGIITNITNTCSIDYHLFSLWILFKLAPNFLDQFINFNETLFLLSIVQNIEKNNWNKAKEIWITEMLQINTNQQIISLYQTENNVFFDKLKVYQSFKTIQLCSTGCIFNNNVIINDDGYSLFLTKDDKKNVIPYTGITHKCRNCNNPTSSRIEFFKLPSFVFIESIARNIRYQEVPKELAIGNIEFKHLSSTLHQASANGLSDHFISVFDLDGNSYLINDLDQSCTLLQPFEKYKNYGRYSSERMVYTKHFTTFSCFFRSDII